MKDPRRHGREPDDRENEWTHADGEREVERSLPWEEPRDGRLGEASSVAHRVCRAFLR